MTYYLHYNELFQATYFDDYSRDVLSGASNYDSRRAYFDRCIGIAAMAFEIMKTRRQTFDRYYLIG